MLSCKAGMRSLLETARDLLGIHIESRSARPSTRRRGVFYTDCCRRLVLPKRTAPESPLTQRLRIHPMGAGTLRCSRLEDRLAKRQLRYLPVPSICLETYTRRIL